MGVRSIAITLSVFLSVCSLACLKNDTSILCKTFHPGFGGRDSPSIVLDDFWKHIFLATEAPSDSFDL